MSTDPLVVFTPSGKRGRFARGTPVLTAARQLGVDLDSVCGGRGICSKCQITPSYGEFPKHGLTSREGALSEWNAVEQRYDDKRGLKAGRRLGCQARIEGDVGIVRLTADLPVLSTLQSVLRRGKWQVTAAVHHSHHGGPAKLVALFPGLHETGIYGLAVDLGSTTIAAHLTNLDTGEVVGSSGLMNP